MKPDTPSLFVDSPKTRVRNEHRMTIQANRKSLKNTTLKEKEAKKKTGIANSE